MTEDSQATVKPGPKTKEGTVIKAKMMKTIVVEVIHTHRHEKYPKALKRRERYSVHDEQGCKAGDQVRIEETRPMSKTKRWKVREVLKRATVLE
jgi:small subunit ribosomal protein S17